VKEQFDEADISSPFPQQDIHVLPGAGARTREGDNDPGAKISVNLLRYLFALQSPPSGGGPNLMLPVGS
jgi:hypothetical protein